jgi:hypothetical protein
MKLLITLVSARSLTQHPKTFDTAICTLPFHANRQLIKLETAS